MLCFGMLGEGFLFLVWTVLYSLLKQDIKYLVHPQIEKYYSLCKLRRDDTLYSNLSEQKTSEEQPEEVSIFQPLVQPKAYKTSKHHRNKLGISDYPDLPIPILPSSGCKAKRTGHPMNFNIRTTNPQIIKEVEEVEELEHNTNEKKDERNIYKETYSQYPNKHGRNEADNTSCLEIDTLSENENFKGGEGWEADSADSDL